MIRMIHNTAARNDPGLARRLSSPPRRGLRGISSEHQGLLHVSSMV